MLCIALFLLIRFEAYANDNCSDCHKVKQDTSHANVDCLTCHPASKDHFQKSISVNENTVCLTCHKKYKGMQNSIMHTQKGEWQQIHRAMGKEAERFKENNCQSCHVQTCSDCHMEKGSHLLTKPDNTQCYSCHNGYFTGIEYQGLALKNEHKRFQRGVKIDDQYYQAMLPDVHFEAGLTCADCHSMMSLSEGKKTAKTCTDCHTSIDKTIPEHQVETHLTKMECYTCHSAWAAQEYGTFFMEFENSKMQRLYNSVTTQSGNWVRSSFLKENGAFPLGKNERNKVSPIRPQFILYLTKIIQKDVIYENVLKAAEWKAFMPHSVRRETVMCDSCHDNDKRLMLLQEEDDIYDMKKNKLSLKSFWNNEGQTVYNGDFLDNATVNRIKGRSKQYLKGYIQKWKTLTE